VTAGLMQRWQWTGPGTVADDRIERPAPGPGEALLHVHAVGICGTDLHIIDGSIPLLPAPAALGHEIAGRIAAVGPGVDQNLVDARCCVDPLLVCGRCDACRAGVSQHCVRGVELGVTRAGAWQEYVVVPERNCYPVPDHVSFAAASQAEPLHVVLGALDRVVPRPGEAALVIGDGATGLYFTRLLRSMGCRPVTLVGLRPERLALARSWGVDEVIAFDQGSREPGRRFGLVVEAVGKPESIRLAVASAAPGARVVLFGLPTAEVSVDLWRVVTTEITLYGGSNAPQVWPRVVELLADGTAGVEDVISDRLPFERLVDGLARARGDSLKVVLERD
jgi:threonine dehydrogenase-like Zn-dependent dehydrogenase